MSETTVQNLINISVKDVFKISPKPNLNENDTQTLWKRINDLWATIWLRARPGYPVQSLAKVNMEVVYTSCVMTLAVIVDEKALHLLHFLSWLNHSQARILFPEPMDTTTQREIMDKSVSEQNQIKLHYDYCNGIKKLIAQNNYLQI